MPFIRKEDFYQTIDISKEKPPGEFRLDKITDDMKKQTSPGVYEIEGDIQYDDERVDLSKFNYGLHSVFESNPWVTADVHLRHIVTISGILTPFSRADEWAFERLYKKENERRWEKVNGKRVQVLPDFNQLSPDLQKLIKKRFETINSEGSFDTLELGKKYL